MAFNRNATVRVLPQEIRQLGHTRLRTGLYFGTIEFKEHVTQRNYQSAVGLQRLQCGELSLQTCCACFSGGGLSLRGGRLIVCVGGLLLRDGSLCTLDVRVSLRVASRGLGNVGGGRCAPCFALASVGSCPLPLDLGGLDQIL